MLYNHAGACQHALGRTAEAVGDYERVFGMEPGEGLGEEARARQFLAFYQREMALHGARRQHADVRAFCLDRDLHPIFKVGCIILSPSSCHASKQCA